MPYAHHAVTLLEVAKLLAFMTANNTLYSIKPIKPIPLRFHRPLIV